MAWERSLKRDSHLENQSRIFRFDLDLSEHAARIKSILDSEGTSCRNLNGKWSTELFIDLLWVVTITIACSELQTNWRYLRPQAYKRAIRWTLLSVSFSDCDVDGMVSNFTIRPFEVIRGLFLGELILRTCMEYWGKCSVLMVALSRYRIYLVNSNARLSRGICAQSLVTRKSPGIRNFGSSCWAAEFVGATLNVQSNPFLLSSSLIAQFVG